jgi:molybdopterin-guanine dinucleotide biosynthesis protein A
VANTTDRSSVTGLILAGGLATRMGGGEKALLDCGGRPLLAHVRERLAPQVASLLINANREHTRYRTFGLPLVADVIADHPGPLAGLHAGLLACGTPLLTTAPCDAPLLPLDLVARLRAALAVSDAPAAVAETSEGLQPTFILCRREAADSIAAYLAENQRSVHGWLERIGAVRVRFRDTGAFRNINTPEELAELAAGLAHPC